MHLDAGYDSRKTRDQLAARGMSGQIAYKGRKAPVQAGQGWHVERTNAWYNAFNRLQRCYESREEVIDAFFDLADAIITVRSPIRQAWTTYRWNTRPGRSLSQTFSGTGVHGPTCSSSGALAGCSFARHLGAPSGGGRRVGQVRYGDTRRR